MDFGGLKQFKEWAKYMFDHTLLIAEDDPYLDRFKELADVGVLNTPQYTGLVDLRVVPGVGCEKFAQLAYYTMTNILEEAKTAGTLLNPTVRVKSVEVFEHGANSAIYEA